MEVFIYILLAVFIFCILVRYIDDGKEAFVLTLAITMLCILVSDKSVGDKGNQSEPIVNAANSSKLSRNVSEEVTFYRINLEGNL